MKATELRVGNIVTVYDEPGRHDFVLVLEPGLVQLMGRPEPDDENNIIGVPLTAELLSQYAIPIGRTFSFGGEEILLEPSLGVDSGLLQVRRHRFSVRWMHELQNILFCLCGRELVTHPHVHALQMGDLQP